MGCAYSLACGGALPAARPTAHADDATTHSAADPLAAIPDTCDVRDDYRVLECVGKGSFGSVSRAVHRATGRVVALKTMLRASVKPASIYREYSVLESLGQHPHCVGYSGTYKTPGAVTFVLEYMPGGELFERLLRDGACVETDVRLPARRLAEALRYIHGRGIVHRDIKPENILLASAAPRSFHMKLADFGLSQLIGQHERLLKVCGTWAYAAPEMSDPARPGYDARFDCFSFGVCLYTMLSGAHPFDPTGELPVAEIKRRARAAQFDFAGAEWALVSQAAQDLIARLIVKDPERRPSSEALLRHPWLADAVPLPRSEPRLRLEPRRDDEGGGTLTSTALSRSAPEEPLSRPALEHRRNRQMAPEGEALRSAAPGPLHKPPSSAAAAALCDGRGGGGGGGARHGSGSGGTSLERGRQMAPASEPAASCTRGAARSSADGETGAASSARSRREQQQQQQQQPPRRARACTARARTARAHTTAAGARDTARGGAAAAAGGACEGGCEAGHLDHRDAQHAAREAGPCRAGGRLLPLALTPHHAAPRARASVSSPLAAAAATGGGGARLHVRFSGTDTSGVRSGLEPASGDGSGDNGSACGGRTRSGSGVRARSATSSTTTTSRVASSSAALPRADISTASAAGSSPAITAASVGSGGAPAAAGPAVTSPAAAASSRAPRAGGAPAALARRVGVGVASPVALEPHDAMRGGAAGCVASAVSIADSLDPQQPVGGARTPLSLRTDPLVAASPASAPAALRALSPQLQPSLVAALDVLAAHPLTAVRSASPSLPRVAATTPLMLSVPCGGRTSEGGATLDVPPLPPQVRIRGGGDAAHAGAGLLLLPQPLSRADVRAAACRPGLVATPHR